MYGIRRISQPDLRAVRFANKIEEQKLNGSVIKKWKLIWKFLVIRRVQMNGVNLTTLEPLRATQRNSCVNLATLIDSLDLLTLLRIIISFTEE